MIYSSLFMSTVNCTAAGILWIPHLKICETIIGRNINMRVLLVRACVRVLNVKITIQFLCLKSCCCNRGTELRYRPILTKLAGRILSHCKIAT